MARLSLLVAISGGSKSPFLKMTERVLKSTEVRQAFADALNVTCRPLQQYEFYSAQGSNLEGLLAHAKKHNAPVGIMSKHEEVADTVSKLGQPAKDKLQPRQVITLSNPALTPEKAAWGHSPQLSLGGSEGGIDGLRARQSLLPLSSIHG